MTSLRLAILKSKETAHDIVAAERDAAVLQKMQSREGEEVKIIGPKPRKFKRKGLDVRKAAENDALWREGLEIKLAEINDIDEGQSLRIRTGVTFKSAVVDTLCSSSKTSCRLVARDEDNLIERFSTSSLVNRVRLIDLPLSDVVVERYKIGHNCFVKFGPEDYAAKVVQVYPDFVVIKYDVDGSHEIIHSLHFKDRMRDSGLSLQPKKSRKRTSLSGKTAKSTPKETKRKKTAKSTPKETKKKKRIGLQPKLSTSTEWVQNAFLSVSGVRVRKKELLSVVDLMGGPATLEDAKGDVRVENWAKLAAVLKIPSEDEEQKETTARLLRAQYFSLLSQKDEILNSRPAISQENPKTFYAPWIQSTRPQHRLLEGEAKNSSPPSSSSAKSSPSSSTSSNTASSSDEEVIFSSTAGKKAKKRKLKQVQRSQYV
jgi:hypothetical protein